MISRSELNDLANQWGLAERVVEKDYVIGWLLWGIGTEPLLHQGWAFKGGTCLKKCYIETYRFSEDLDFSVMPDGPLLPEEVLPALARVLDRTGQESGISFEARAPLYKPHGHWPSGEGRIYYRGPRQTPNVESIKLDLLGSETVVRPTVLRTIAHPYSDNLPGTAIVRCYSFDEVFAEKLRALGERGRSRDLYDVINLYRRRDLQLFPDVVALALADKCRTKGVAIPTFASIENAPHRSEMESEWRNMLEHQLPFLPTFGGYWQELAQLFEWLEGRLVRESLPSIPSMADEDLAWRPPATIWAWGQGSPLETIRFAAVNHLCVELGYDGRQRLIEPYSLRRTRDGFLLLHALRSDSHAHRSYRVDRIQRARVVNQPFQPIYQIEFGVVGPLAAPPSPPRTRGIRLARLAAGKYMIECPQCGRRFRRSSPDRNLRPHVGRDGRACNGRHGRPV